MAFNTDILRGDAQLIRIPRHSPEWFDYRQTGIGASEVPIVMRLKYWDDTGIWRLWEEKVGLRIVEHEMTEKMHHGLYMEEYIEDQWQFWDNRLDMFGNPMFIKRWQDYEEAKRNGKGNKNDFIVRACRMLNGFVVNPNYPHLYVSLDRWTFPNTMKVNFLEECDHSFPVEFKNLGEFTAKQYESKFPEYYHAQGQAQMAVSESEYMEFATMNGGNRFQVNGFNINNEYVADIVYKVGVFWRNHVLPARELLKEAQELNLQNRFDEANFKMAELRSRYEPEPTTGDEEQYYNYLTERAIRELDPTTKLPGSDTIFNKAREWKIWDELSKYSKIRSTALKNEIMEEFRLHNAWVFDYGDKGRVSMVKSNDSVYPKNSLKEPVIDKKIYTTFPEKINVEDYFEN